MKRKSENDIVDVLLKKHKHVDNEEVNEAKRIEKLEEKIRLKNEEGRKQAEDERAKLTPHDNHLIKPKHKMHILPETVIEPLTVREAKKVEDLDRKVRNEYITVQLRETQDKTEREKQLEPVVKVIKEQTEEVVRKPKTIKRVQIRKPVEQFRPRAASTPGKTLEKDTPLPETSEDDISTAAASTQETDERQNQSIREFVEHNMVGDIAKKYLATGSDPVFGIYYNFQKGKLAIGSQTITIAGDDIILENETLDRYTGTNGLWCLLTDPMAGYLHPSLEMFIEDGYCTENDLKEYKDILIKTNSIYRNNDPSSKRPKASPGWKWAKIVSPIWYEMKKQTTGSGLKFYTDNKIEYKYISKLKDLIDRLLYIQAQEEAGNNNFHNEKMSVVKFIYDKMEDLISKPNGIKYVIRCLTSLPEKDIKGNGLLSGIINDLPFMLESHITSKPNNTLNVNNYERLLSLASAKRKFAKGLTPMSGYLYSPL